MWLQSSRHPRRAPQCRCGWAGRWLAGQGVQVQHQPPRPLGVWSTAAAPPCRTVDTPGCPLLPDQELVHESPEHVIQTLQREGMQRVASFCLPVRHGGRRCYQLLPQCRNQKRLVWWPASFDQPHVAMRLCLRFRSGYMGSWFFLGAS